jgi:hypothetical protein
MLGGQQGQSTPICPQQGAGDGQPEAGAPIASPGGEEWLEDALPVFHWNAWSVIGHIDGHAVAAPHLDGNACRAVLAAVADQAGQHGLQRIARDGGRGILSRYVGTQVPGQLHRMAGFLRAGIQHVGAGQFEQAADEQVQALGIAGNIARNLARSDSSMSRPCSASSSMAPRMAVSGVLNS